MAPTRSTAWVVSAALWLLLGCGGSNQVSISTGGGTGGNLSLSIRDTPPSGVSILAFEVTISGAALQPGNVPLLNGSVPLEIKKLETDTAFLNLSSVPPGTYTSLQLSFANPSMTIQNNSGATITVGSVNCANNTVCQISPVLTSATTSFSGTPFPLAVSGAQQIGLVVDLDLNGSIQANLSVTPTATLALLPSAQGTGQVEEVEFAGQVKTVGTNQLTVQNPLSNLTLTLNVDGSTQFEDFTGCSLANISCVAANQIIEVLASFTGAGTLLAKEIELEAGTNMQVIEGVIVSVPNPQTSPPQFTMVALESEGVSQVTAGNQVTVTLSTSPAPVFSVAKMNLDAASFSFSSSADLIVGQQVQVRPVSPPTTAPIRLTTDMVRLRMSQLTANVQGVSGSAITLNTLQPFFTNANPPINQAQANAQLATEFEGVPNITALVTNSIVSVRGPLFNNHSGITPVVVLAKKVRKR